MTFVFKLIAQSFQYSWITIVYHAQILYRLQATEYDVIEKWNSTFYKEKK